jgi:hypothetical protein
MRAACLVTISPRECAGKTRSRRSSRLRAALERRGFLPILDREEGGDGRHGHRPDRLRGRPHAGKPPGLSGPGGPQRLRGRAARAGSRLWPLDREVGAAPGHGSTPVGLVLAHQGQSFCQAGGVPDASQAAIDLRLPHHDLERATRTARAAPTPSPPKAGSTRPRTIETTGTASSASFTTP